MVMPYIKKEERKNLDPIVDNLVDQIISQDGMGINFAGMLNYVVTRTILQWIKKTGGIRYFKIALITGALKNIADEFYRKNAIPYEDEKIEENGDVEV
jgi:hypothetical protein